MSKIIVVKEVVTETAHRLPNYDGACKNIHGHSYRWQVGISGEVDKGTGMVIDFKVLKNIMEEEIVNQFDHKLILFEKDNDIYHRECDIVHWDVLPTVENFVFNVALSISIALKSFNCVLEFVRCWETEKSYAEYVA